MRRRPGANLARKQANADKGVRSVAQRLKNQISHPAFGYSRAEQGMARMRQTRQMPVEPPHCPTRDGKRGVGPVVDQRLTHQVLNRRRRSVDPEVLHNGSLSLRDRAEATCCLLAFPTFGRSRLRIQNRMAGMGSDTVSTQASKGPGPLKKPAPKRATLAT